MKLCMIGTGYVGLVSGVCFADLGNNVICVDKNLKKMSLMAFNDPSTSTNPIPVNEEDFLKIYVNSFKGDL